MAAPRRPSLGRAVPHPVAGAGVGARHLQRRRPVVQHSGQRRHRQCAWPLGRLRRRPVAADLRRRRLAAADRHLRLGGAAVVGPRPAAPVAADPAAAALALSRRLGVDRRTGAPELADDGGLCRLRRSVGGQRLGRHRCRTTRRGDGRGGAGRPAASIRARPDAAPTPRRLAGRRGQDRVCRRASVAPRHARRRRAKCCAPRAATRRVLARRLVAGRRRGRRPRTPAAPRATSARAGRRTGGRTAASGAPGGDRRYAGQEGTAQRDGATGDARSRAGRAPSAAAT